MRCYCMECGEIGYHGWIYPITGLIIGLIIGILL